MSVPPPKESTIWKFPRVPSFCGTQFLSVCLLHRNMSPSGCLRTEIIAPLYSAHLATLLKAGMLRAAATCVQSARTTCHFFRPHENRNRARREKKQHGRPPKAAFLAAETNAETCTICKNWRRLYKKSVIKPLAQSAWLAHLSALFYFCSEALLSVFFL